MRKGVFYCYIIKKILINLETSAPNQKLSNLDPEAALSQHLLFYLLLHHHLLQPKKQTVYF